MNIVRAFIVEDSPEGVELIRNLLQIYHPDVEVVGDADSVDSAYQSILALKPNLLFLDIGIYGGTSFDLLQKFKDIGGIEAEFVFVTGRHSDEFAMKALEYSATDYLKKPIEKEALMRAVDKARHQIDLEEVNRRLKEILDTLPYRNSRITTLMVDLPNSKKEPVWINDILYLEAEGVITIFHFTNRPPLKGMRNLGEYEKILMKDYDFFRIHKSRSVNVDHIKYNNPSTITLSTEVELGVSRHRAKELTNYLQQRGIAQKKHSVLSQLLNLFSSK